ncbi:MAG TPA: PadR family transcriptional regulator [Gemmatimonadaceae bacterium]|nr:PadR family transcriptional regulator [Gemmatimonadaceae bacterium]
MCHHGQDSESRGRRKGFAFDPASVMGFWWSGGGAGSGGHRGRGPRGGRIFEQGDLKYVILQLLEEKPRHGYDIIKELEDRFAGTYSPSPGTVYPTLSMLEDMGYARAQTEEGGRKIYEITEEGKAYLEENRGTVTDIFDRIADLGSSIFSTEMMALNQAFKRLGWVTYSNAPKLSRDADKLKSVRDILERAAAEIEAALA